VCRARAINLKGVLIVVVLIKRRAHAIRKLSYRPVFHPLIANLMNLFFPRRCFVSRDTYTQKMINWRQAVQLMPTMAHKQ
jgi:hypothetical protein